MIVVEHKLVMNPANKPVDKVLIFVIEELRKRTFGRDIRESLNKRGLKIRSLYLSLRCSAIEPLDGMNMSFSIDEAHKT